jgi:DNA (cytosine-5)-methyltransferase 1
MKLTHFSLFTGIGGIDLAAEWADFTTVGQCEFADYPTKVLEKHWPNVPRWRDIRSVTAESFYERTKFRTVNLISGGFPCQPFSTAGKRKGEDDDRYLWPEMLRVISELKPTWVLGENVAGIVTMALDTVLTDLENQGYETQSFIIPAAGVGAPHRRKRVFILGYSNRQRRSWSNGVQKSTLLAESSEDVADTNSEPRFQTDSETCAIREERNTWDNASRSSRGCEPGANWWSTEPDVGRVANGIPDRVDRLKCLGNAVVPQQVYPILQAIADIERSLQCK